jgi:predicted DNA-binding transcriptional regulator YafY
MRADRLVATLLLLQARGRVTAAEVAVELEISERTARRDLEALSVAGIPVYSQQGRGGGWSLVGGARTDLSGLTASEARALFLVTGPASTATPAIKAALRKLVRALPESFRAEAEAASRAVVVDPAAWGRHAQAAPEQPPFLDALQRAVVQGVQVRLGYVGRERVATERVVHPLGLVVKGPVWYLIAGTDAGQRTFRVSRVTSVEPTGEPVVRPQGFELADVWRDVAATIDAHRTPVKARVLARPESVGIVRYLLGSRVTVGAPHRPDGRADPGGRIELVVGGHSVPSLAGELGGLGAMIEVLSPPELRDALAAVGADLVTMYGSRV